ncbi:MAG: hypothetical protein ABR499_20010 [Gemmatimonadaceae bacterium]
MRRLAGVGAVAVLICLAPPLRGQTAQPISVQLSGLYEGLSGDAFEDMRPGVGVEAQLRYTRGAWSVGLGYQTVRHRYGFCYVPLSGGGCARVIPARITGSGIFFEPRYVFDAGSDVFAPYVSGRFSIVRQSDTGDPLFDFSVTGSSANGGGGLLVRVTPRVNFDAGATFGYTRFSSYRAVDKETGDVITGSAGGAAGSNFVLRVGVAIGIGG